MHATWTCKLFDFQLFTTSEYYFRPEQLFTDTLVIKQTQIIIPRQEFAKTVHISLWHMCDYCASYGNLQNLRFLTFFHV